MPSQNSDKKNLESPEIGHWPPQWPANAHPKSAVDDEINLLDLLRVINKRKWQILFVTAAFSLIAILLTFIMPRKYTSEVTLMSISQSKKGGLSSLASQMSSIPLVGGQLGGLSEKLGGSKNKEILNLLKSRTLTENIINRFNLMPALYEKQWDSKKQEFHFGFPKFLKPIPVIEDGVNKFQKKFSKVSHKKKTGLIKIQVTTKDPNLSANVANGMVVELQDFINNHSLTVEKRNRIFIEEQMVKNRAKLLEAGKDLNEAYSQKRISSVVPKLSVNVGSYKKLPETFEELRKYLESYGTDLALKEKKSKNLVVPGVPGQVYLQYLMLNRQLLESSHALLTQQYEMSKIEEAKEDLAFQIIDKARVKVRVSSPKLFLNIGVGLLGGLFIALFIAFFREYLEKARIEESH